MVAEWSLIRPVRDAGTRLLLAFIEGWVLASEDFAGALRDLAVNDPDVWAGAVRVAGAIDVATVIAREQLLLVVPALDARTARHLRS